MRKFLLIFVCVFSFSVRSETNVVQLTQDQFYRLIDSIIDYNNRAWDVYISSVGQNGYLYEWQDMYFAGQEFFANGQNIAALLEFLHVIFDGTLNSSYDTQSNNILAYASSLRSHNADVRELLDNIEGNTHATWLEFIRLLPRVGNIENSLNGFHSDYTNNFSFLYPAITNNFNLLYDAITNIKFQVSITNQIDMLSSGISNGLYGVLDSIREFNSDFVSGHTALDLEQAIRHNELMNFLHSLSNSALFASNLCNCCVNSNFQDSVESMLEWMTNNWERISEEDAPVDTNAWDEVTNGTNKVWHVWHPESFGDKLLIPNVGWQEDFATGNYIPYYATNQYDGAFNSIWQQYLALLDDYNANGKDGQKFLAGLVDLQLHILANMSTQLYMIDSKLPSKTNLWDWIEEYKSKISDEVTQAEQENNEIVSSVSYLLDYTPFSSVGGHFPRVSNALNSLKLDQGASPVVRIPIPRALRVSASDELVVDVRESEWFSTGRTWCRWIFTFIWGWLFIRLGIVPIFYVFFFTVRVAEISAHLVFMGSVRGSSGVVSSFGAAAVDMVLSLIGIDTDFKKFVWGIMRD